ncbi:hypothetical protein PIROE2DRAFT_3438 [Piromyces sp. E2]|nr:hypothetical protein PIROE2DRAFT_3438 [Piromyces sp. E2]|eukprot:OUM68752.1 hypothetical protein PIROE2DRAFT_3438 [Piromyces sp. E2]
MVNQRITTLPDELSNLKNLEVLNLSNNDLKSIPESLNTLSKLKEVYFSGESLEGKILTNASLEKCYYSNEAALCKTKEMSCLGEASSLIKKCK